MQKTNQKQRQIHLDSCCIRRKCINFHYLGLLGSSQSQVPWIFKMPVLVFWGRNETSHITKVSWMNMLTRRRRRRRRRGHSSLISPPIFFPRWSEMFALMICCSHAHFPNLEAGLRMTAESYKQEEEKSLLLFVNRRHAGGFVEATGRGRRRKSQVIIKQVTQTQQTLFRQSTTTVLFAGFDHW